ncbi:MAG: RsmD family RNA methyltransferase [Polyangiaceae bacterium]
MHGLAVVDLYAGSGALGIEALSRGAVHATFVECEREALGCIRENIQQLKLEARTSVLALQVEHAAKSLLERGRSYDLVVCDPPWASVSEAAICLPKFAAGLNADARVVFEHPQGQAPRIEGFRQVDERSWGDTGISIFSLESTSYTDRSADESTQ